MSEQRVIGRPDGMGELFQPSAVRPVVRLALGRAVDDLGAAKESVENSLDGHMDGAAVV
jgi:hypothetical protein